MEVTVAESLSPRRETAAVADDLLVAQAQFGDHVARERLLARYRERVYAFALVMLAGRDDAEDVTQETMLRIARCLPEVHRQGHFCAWVFRIARNLCLDHGRRVRRRPATSLEALTVDVPSESDPTREVVLGEAVRNALRVLPRHYREVVALHYFNDLSPAEIATVLGRSRAAVRVQLWRARKLLANELAEWLD